jgi:hypothetical protein
MVFIASRVIFFVLLHVAVTQVSSNNDTATTNGSFPAESTLANKAISTLVERTQAISELRMEENLMYQKVYQRDTQLSESLHKDMMQSKNLRLTSSLQSIIDEAVMGVEEAIGIEQAAQRRYEETMKSMNTHIQELHDFAAGNATQASSSIPTRSDRLAHNTSAASSAPLIRGSATDLKAGSPPLIRGDRVKLLFAQPTWNPPLLVGDEGVVLPAMFRNSYRVRFDKGITGVLASKYLEKNYRTM